MAVTLESLGDVLTDQDLAALVQRGPDWVRNQRAHAKRLGTRPDLPPEIPTFAGAKRARHRYLKRDVVRWLDGERIGRRGRR